MQHFLHGNYISRNLYSFRLFRPIHPVFVGGRTSLQVCHMIKVTQAGKKEWGFPVKVYFSKLYSYRRGLISPSSLGFPIV